MTQAKPRMLARLGSVLLSRAPLPAPLGLAVAVGCIVVGTAVTLMLKALDNAFGVLYLIGVLIVATGWSAGLAAATAVASGIAYDYLRRWPDVSGVLTEAEDWVVIFVFIVVALVAHLLARIARTRAADAEERRQEAEASREQLSVLAEQQAALRRVATQVAHGVPASEVFPAVAHELARCLGVANASVWRYEPDGTATLLAACDDPLQTEQMPVGMSRDLIEQEHALRELGVHGTRLFSTSEEEQRTLDDPDDPQRKLVRRIVGAVNDYDRSMIVSRMQAGRQLKKAAGGYAGGQPPFGWCGGVPSKELAPRADEQAVLARMHELSRQGRSTTAVAQALNDEGMRTRRGGLWSSPMISHHLRHGRLAAAA